MVYLYRFTSAYINKYQWNKIASTLLMPILHNENRFVMTENSQMIELMSNAIFRNVNIQQ
jgi:hypothetical protein